MLKTLFRLSKQGLVPLKTPWPSIPICMLRTSSWASVDKGGLNFSTKFVPLSEPLESDLLDRLQHFIDNARRLLVLTGAGFSTESGIPDYRSDGVGQYARSRGTGWRPIQYQEFVKQPDRRQRYWARNFVGWPRFSSFLPNESHLALAEWEKQGKLHWLVTQNVDALHTKAGNKRLTELHGSTHRIICLNCKTITTRHDLQDRIIEANPEFISGEQYSIAADGDVIIPDESVANFKVPPCENCGGLLKPHLVFFGDNVDREVKDFVFQKVDESDAILVAGSSLEVHYFFVQKNVFY